MVGGATVIAVSLALAFVTHRCVENPVRVSGIGATTRWGAYRFGPLTLVPVLLAAGVWQGVASQRASFTLDAQQVDTLGARAVTAHAPLRDSKRPVVPPFAALPDQFDSFPDDECRYSPRHEELRICTVDPKGEPTSRVVVTGDSHSQQYIAALRPVVERRGWQVISMGKGGCPLTADPTVAPDLRDWNQAVLAEIIDTRPDAVLTMATRDVRAGLTEHTSPGYVAQWRALAAADIPVVAIRDSPRFDHEPSDSVQQHGLNAAQCVVPRQEYLSTAPAIPRRAGRATYRGVPRLQRLLLRTRRVSTGHRQRPRIHGRQPRHRHLPGNHVPDRRNSPRRGIGLARLHRHRTAPLKPEPPGEHRFPGSAVPSPARCPNGYSISSDNAMMIPSGPRT
ncbi:SGNH hydrolase domain-containing protein [Saccharomonospora piscinae]|uniref:SGNH hydrolase domain-containing protein n=1 Tax=Saccharomonospora piscinae TaxID=687388 RepID=UPI0018CC48F8